RADRPERRGNLLKINRSESDKYQQHAQNETEVADAIDDEGFFAGVGCGLLLEPEPDEQIRTEPDTFPSKEHHQEVRTQDEDEHERREQVQVREIARVLRVWLVVHVRGRIDVDQRTDAS